MAHQTKAGEAQTKAGEAARRPLPLVLVLAIWLIVPLALPLHAADQPSSAGTAASLNWKLAKTNPDELVRRASENELAHSFPHSPPMRYRVRKITATTDTTKQIVQTRQGGVARLIAAGGHTLPAARERLEVERLQTLDTHPALEAHRRTSELRDVRRVQKFTRLLPAAFRYRFAGSVPSPDGRLIRLTFTPNPAFSPPDLGSRIMTGIRGEVWIDPQDLRIARMKGRIFRTVDFGWGILGSLSPGGTMQLEQSKTKDCGWQLTRLSLHLDGKELVFKSLHISLEETASDYQLVPPTWNYRDAVQWLLRMHA